MNSNDASTSIARREAASPGKEVCKAEFVSLPLDHWDANAGTYQNRFWVSEANYTQGVPAGVRSTLGKLFLEKFHAKAGTSASACSVSSHSKAVAGVLMLIGVGTDSP